MRKGGGEGGRNKSHQDAGATSSCHHGRHTEQGTLDIPLLTGVHYSTLLRGAIVNRTKYC